MKPATETQKASASTPYASGTGASRITGAARRSSAVRSTSGSCRSAPRAGDDLVAVQLAPLDERVGDPLDRVLVRLDQVVGREVRLAEQLLDHDALARVAEHRRPPAGPQPGG